MIDDHISGIRNKIHRSQVFKNKINFPRKIIILSLHVYFLDELVFFNLHFIYIFAIMFIDENYILFPIGDVMRE